MRHTKALLTVILAIAGICGASGQDRSGLERFTMKDQGLQREYLLYLPESPMAEAPLVVDLHGYGSTVDKYWSGLLDVAKKEGFALCVPQGAPDPKGKPSWNVGYPSQEGYRIDDVKFIRKLVRKLQKEHSLNPKNTFLTGMSNGGEMCYIMAMVGGGVFRAFASNAGLMMDWAYRKYEAPGPVPFMEVHGTEDKTSKWNGDPLPEDKWGKYIAVPAAVGYWVAKNRCNTEITERPESRPGASHEVILHRYVNGTDGCEVRLYEVVGGGHGFFRDDFDQAGAVWGFFSGYLSRQRGREE